MDRSQFWNAVYTEKADGDLSWYQARSTFIPRILERVALPKEAAVLDVGGGGPSAFVDDLLGRGYTEVSVLDVSRAALERCQQRLGECARSVTWLEADITRFVPPRRYDFWHDRAAFHFLTAPEDQQAYFAALARGLKVGGWALLATFAPEGPPRCSGLEVCRWSPEALLRALGDAYVLEDSFRETHRTPWEVSQVFACGLFRRVREQAARATGASR